MAESSGTSRKRRRASEHDIFQSHSGQDDIYQSHSGHHDIFLSHSGHEEPFVEQLFYDLIRAGQHPFFDQDLRDSLPIKEIPPYIFDAAEQCRIVVVVLSQDYLTSMWPMLELSKFVESMKTSNPELRLFPLYFKLSPSDLSQEEVEWKWKPVWTYILEKHKMNEEVVKEKAESWSEAVKALRAVNGMEYASFANSEYKYRSAVVRQINKLLPPISRWRTDNIQGYERLCKMASSMFEDYESRKYLGLYGMAGVGKSTLCKAMCNFCQAEFGADVYYVELKSDKADDRLARLKVVLQQMRVDSLILNYLATEEQGWECLRMTLQEKPQIFLAIDNVGDSESSKDEARLYLGAELPLNSMVLITSRSKDVLNDVLEDVFGLLAPCKPIPRLQDDEALNLFLSEAIPGKSYLELNTKEMEIVKMCLIKCQFEERGYGYRKYHPLILEASGTYFHDVGSNIVSCSEQLEGKNTLQRRVAKHVNSVLGLAYEPLSDEMKLIFLDTVLYPHYGYAPLPWWSLSELPFGHDYLGEKVCLRRREDAWSWVSWIAEVNGVSLVNARMMLKKLQRLALLEVSPVEEAIQSNLATQELFKNYGLFSEEEYISGEELSSGEELFANSKVLRMKKPLVHELYKGFAKGLVEKEGSMEWKWWMSREELGQGEVPKLKRVVIEKDMPLIGHPPKKLHDWMSLTLLELVDCLEFGPNNVLDLGGLSNLRALAVDNCRGLKGIVSSCNNGGNHKGLIKEENHGGCISHLTSVMLQGLASLVDVSFLDHNQDIESLRIMNCNGSIYPTSHMNSRIMDLRMMKKLHTLIVWDCLVEVDEANIDTLIQWLYTTLRFQELLAFEYRVMEGPRNLQQVMNIGKNKKNKDTSYTIDLYRESERCTSKLSVLSLLLPRQIKHIRGLHRLSELRTLNLSGCEGLSEFPDLRGLTKLKQICVHGCHRMELGHPYSLGLQKFFPRSNHDTYHLKEIPLIGHSFEAFLRNPGGGCNMKDFSYMEVEHECFPGSRDGKKKVVSPKLPK